MDCEVGEFFDSNGMEDSQNFPLSWIDVRDQMMKHGVDSLPIVYEWHKNHTSSFDDWTNYLLALTYFKEELEFETPNQKLCRKKLEKKIKREMKKGNSIPSIAKRQVFVPEEIKSMQLLG